MRLTADCYVSFGLMTSCSLLIYLCNFFPLLSLKTRSAQRPEDYGLYLSLHLLCHSAGACQAGTSDGEQTQCQALSVCAALNNTLHFSFLLSLLPSFLIECLICVTLRSIDSAMPGPVIVTVIGLNHGIYSISTYSSRMKSLWNRLH